MKVALPFLGLTLPQVRNLTRVALRRNPTPTLGDYQQVLTELFIRAQHQEERYAALAIAGDRTCKRFQTKAVLPLYERMIKTAQWWDLVDDISTRVGDVLLAAPEAVAPRLIQWARGNDLWLRRAAIICQRKRKRETDLDLLYACIEPSLGSDEFFLNKAIGWALRSVACYDPKQVRRYVQQNSARLSPLSRREALKNLA
jgi:3-methyladenine DNA glycosylase AlkD